MTENDLLYTLALQHVPNIGDITAKRLISYCGSAEAVLKEKKQSLLKINGIGAAILGDLFELHHLKEAEKEIIFIKENNMSINKSKTSFLTSGSNGGIDDEYYINEIIGIDELTYEDYVKKPKKEQQQLESDSDKDLKIPF